MFQLSGVYCKSLALILPGAYGWLELHALAASEKGDGLLLLWGFDGDGEEDGDGKDCQDESDENDAVVEDEYES